MGPCRSYCELSLGEPGWCELRGGDFLHLSSLLFRGKSPRIDQDGLRYLSTNVDELVT